MTGPEGLSTGPTWMALVSICYVSRPHIWITSHTSEVKALLDSWCDSWQMISLFAAQQILTGQRVGTIDAMAYDWTSKVLFWTTSSYKSVVAFKVTDKSRRDIVTGLRYPKGIAVHPSDGWVLNLIIIKQTLSLAYLVILYTFKCTLVSLIKCWSSATCSGRTGIGQQSSWEPTPTAAMLSPWSTQHWDGLTDSLSIMSKHSDDLQGCDVSFPKNKSLCWGILLHLLANHFWMVGLWQHAQAVLGGFPTRPCWPHWLPRKWQADIYQHWPDHPTLLSDSL